MPQSFYKLEQLHSTCIAVNCHQSKFYDQSLQSLLWYSYRNFFITWIILWSEKYWCVENGWIKKPFVQAIHNCLHIHSPSSLHSSSVSSGSTIYPWCIGWYVPSTSSFALHLNTPTTQAWEKTKPKFLVDQPNLGPWPHKKCHFKIGIH